MSVGGYVFSVQKRRTEKGVYDVKLVGTPYGFTVSARPATTITRDELEKAATGFVQMYREDGLI